MAALLLDNASVEVVGATTLYGREPARRIVLYGMLFGVERMATASVDEWPGARFTQGVIAKAPRVEARLHRGEWVLLHWYTHEDGDAVRALTRLEAEGDRIARVHNYFYNHDLILEVCAELGLPARPNGYRWRRPNR